MRVCAILLQLPKPFRHHGDGVVTINSIQYYVCGPGLYRLGGYLVINVYNSGISHILCVSYSPSLHDRLVTRVRVKRWGYIRLT